MDLFEGTCQGIGLALAAGVFAGAIAGATESSGNGMGPLSGLLLTIAGLGGAYAFGASLDDADHPAWPGWFVGAALVVGAFWVIRDLVSGAAARAGEGGSATAIAGMAAVAAVVIAALSLLWGPLGLLALAGIAYLGIGRRRRAAQKHEGLRSLR
jgi:hypothetical protein